MASAEARPGRGGSCELGGGMIEGRWVFEIAFIVDRTLWRECGVHGMRMMCFARVCIH